MRKDTLVYNEMESPVQWSSFRVLSHARFLLLTSPASALAIQPKTRVTGRYAMSEQQRPFGKWTREELFGAETTAREFLEDNSAAIAETMRAKAKLLETLIQRVAHSKTSFDDRLEYFARISEIASLIRQDADGFFQIASQPVVARILKSVRPNGRPRP